MRILNDKDQEITTPQIADLKGAPVPPEVSARERKRQLLQPLFDRLKRLGIGGEAQARTWCEGALAHPLARMADIKEEEIPSLVETAKKALGELVAVLETPFFDAVEECIKNSPSVPEETKVLGEPEPLATSVVPEVTDGNAVSTSGPAMVSEELEDNDAGSAPMPGVPPRPSLEVAISSHASITSGRLAPYITRLRSWNMRKLSPERRKRFRDTVTEVEMAWDNLRQELQALAAEGFVAKTSPSTRMAATLRPGDAVTLADSQIALFGEVYGADELANLKVDAVTDTHAVVSGPLRSLGPVKLCHLAKKA